MEATGAQCLVGALTGRGAVGINPGLGKARIAQCEALCVDSLVCNEGLQPPGFEGAKPLAGVWGKPPETPLR